MLRLALIKIRHLYKETQESSIPTQRAAKKGRRNTQLKTGGSHWVIQNQTITASIVAANPARATVRRLTSAL